MDDLGSRLAPFALIFNLIVYLCAVGAVGEIAIHYWGWPGWIAYIASSAFWFFTRGLGPVGLILAIWGAIVGWNWPWWLAIGLFMWPFVLTVFLGIGHVSIGAIKSTFGSREAD